MMDINCGLRICCVRGLKLIAFLNLFLEAEVSLIFEESVTDGINEEHQWI